MSFIGTSKQFIKLLFEKVIMDLPAPIFRNVTKMNTPYKRDGDAAKLLH